MELYAQNFKHFQEQHFMCFFVVAFVAFINAKTAELGTFIPDPY